MSTSFEDFQEITRLKYSYCRFLDTKDFAAMCGLMTEDVTVAYGGGAITLTGRQEVQDYLSNAMGSPTMLSSHLVSHPEIDVDGDSAVGRWALQDVVILEDFKLAIRGASLYEDRYVRVDGRWLIQHTGYKRLYEEIGPRGEETRTTAAWFGTDGRSSLV
ncbi:MAG: SnoaL-like domain [Frankiales bacterium]|nr:SnoaL-like domain [Frankiales bacterium]